MYMCISARSYLEGGSSSSNGSSTHIKIKRRCGAQAIPSKNGFNRGENSNNQHEIFEIVSRFSKCLNCKLNIGNYDFFMNEDYHMERKRSHAPLPLILP